MLIVWSVNNKAGTYLHNGIVHGPKKEEMPLLETVWMGLESIVLSEISLSKKDMYHMISLLSGT